MRMRREEVVSFFLFSLLSLWGFGHCTTNYTDALEKSILFFQGQRSGRLPSSHQITWRSHSALSDGLLANVNLSGGYYDGGDNVKFNFPLSFTATMLSWSTLDYSARLGSQLPNARAAIRWATDYLLKCATATPGKLYVGVGDPNIDHRCWERPEDMDTTRTVYSVSAANPGSDVTGETAAALASASMVFRRADPKYASFLLKTAKNVFEFALQQRGAYSDSLGSAVCPFYCSYSGYQDELIWGAAWLYRATNQVYYYNILKSLGSGNDVDIFSWDNKYAGAQVLLSRRALLNKDNNSEQYKQKAENFICKILPNSPSSTTQYTPVDVQIDYILGENPKGMSYMVGFGQNYPKRIHHRGSSLPSKESHPEVIGCSGGFQPYYYTANPNPNVLSGAIVGGPDQRDGFGDERTDYSHSEPATYINAAVVGPLSYFSYLYR